MTVSPFADNLARLRDNFDRGTTRSYAFRKQQLLQLKQSILDHEQDLYAALYADLKKSPEESWVTEIGMTLAEIAEALRNLRRWMEPEKMPTNLLNLPSTSRLMREPLGVVLVIGPWNYPFQLCMVPLLGAIAAGNCVVVKPSELAPATEAVIKKIIASAFTNDYVLFVRGEGVETIPAMMNHFSFDHVFYTGGPQAGKAVYKMAAERMVPVTLELGGKSPCVVEADANIRVAARRITAVKFSNAGQMCVAPDYLLVHESKKQELLAALSSAIKQFYTDQPAQSYNYGKMINNRQFDRVVSYLSNGTIAYGGSHNRDQLFIEPTLLIDISPEDPVMQQEIFGPVLPVLSFSTTNEAKDIIRRHPNPLAFYVFTASAKKEKEWLEGVSFGGGCVNNAGWQLTNPQLPFGGRGISGMGRYHGRYSFETFSHLKSVMKTPVWFDPAIKYPPFKGRLNLFKKIIK